MFFIKFIRHPYPLSFILDLLSSLFVYKSLKSLNTDDNDDDKSRMDFWMDVKGGKADISPIICLNRPISMSSFYSVL